MLTSEKYFWFGGEAFGKMGFLLPQGGEGICCR